MAREKELFRVELEQILDRFGGRQIISFRDVQAYTGKGYDWCCSHLDIPHDGCTAAQLAHALTNLGSGRRLR